MNQQAIINGGEKIDIFIVDGGEIKTETVLVKLLKIAQFEDYLRNVENEPRLAEVLCDKPEGWGETLVPESLLDVIDKGHDINFTTVCRWAERRANLGEAMMPLAQKGMALKAALPSSAPTAPLS